MSKRVFTAVVAWIVFRENVDRRIALGMLAIVAGACCVTGPGAVAFSIRCPPSLFPPRACAGRSTTTSLAKSRRRTRRWSPARKACSPGQHQRSRSPSARQLPPLLDVGAGLVVGLPATASASRSSSSRCVHLGTARAGAYFSVAPLFGVRISRVVAGVARCDHSR